ncbi:lipC [Symbiodinium natans]|uniref:LipC protein n=1 Tax=Symbiodinium natans TaxID=878477 RepID=A0A812R7J6_9DINO|nr:lipC [Symbiodinium natans]
MEQCTWLLWLAGWWGLGQLAYGEPGPYVLCLSLASHLRVPPPFGQVPPLLDVLMTYLIGHSTFYACLFGGLFCLSSSLWRPCWLLSSASCAWASLRRRQALSLLELQPQPRPPQPWLTLLHPYNYFFLSEVPGATEPVRIQRIHPPTLRVPIDLWQQAPAAAGLAPAAPRPVLILLHGGAWRGGGARVSPQGPLLQALAADGFLVVSFEYRRRLGTQWPMQLEDCLAALEWLEAEAAGLGADLSDVSIAGTSAGGHLAALLLARSLGERPSSIRFRAALLFYPALDPGDRTGATVKSPFSCRCLGVRHGMSFLAWFFEVFVLWQDRRLWPSAEPLEALQSASAASRELAEAWPPTLIVHGELDGVVPVEHSRRFLTQLAAASGTQKQGGDDLRSQDHLFTVPLARHTFEMAIGDLANASYDAAIAWLSHVRKDACAR